MPPLRSEITEIVTGLGMLGFPDIDRALEVRPDSVRNVGPEHYDRLDAARTAGLHQREFEVAWRNGVDFARSTDGLRGRPPWSLEWKGAHRPPGYDQIPADLRVDHVYLVSCKYGSDILTNSSPWNLFDRLLADPSGTRGDWYSEVAPDAYQAFYDTCRVHLEGGGLPDLVDQLDRIQRNLLKKSIPSHLTGELRAAYRRFAAEVGIASARRWRDRLSTLRTQELMTWRLLRLQAAPYFVLGESAVGQRLRFRVSTPWDFRNRYRFLGLETWADDTRHQPVVHWQATVFDTTSDRNAEVAGHVEVRWSHGRFAGMPEAKVYLDTPHALVPGYVPLDETIEPEGSLAIAP